MTVSISKPYAETSKYVTPDFGMQYDLMPKKWNTETETRMVGEGKKAKFQSFKTYYNRNVSTEGKGEGVTITSKSQSTFNLADYLRSKLKNNTLGKGQSKKIQIQDSFYLTKTVADDNGNVTSKEDFPMECSIIWNYTEDSAITEEYLIDALKRCISTFYKHTDDGMECTLSDFMFGLTDLSGKDEA